MKKTRKLLAISLAAAMAVTSLPGNSGKHAEAAGDASRWIDWDTTKITEGTATGDTYSETKEYSGIEIPDETIGNLESKIKADENVIKTKLGASTSVSDFTYDYAWSVKTDDGEKAIPGETDDSLATGSIPQKYQYNDAPERTILCKVTLSGVTKDSETSPTDPSTDHAADAADFTLKYQYTYKYTGLSEATINSGKHKLEDYFIDDGGQNFRDRESDAPYTSASQNNISLDFYDIHVDWEMENPDYKFYDFTVSFQWAALSAGGAEKTLDNPLGKEISAPLKIDFGKGEAEPVSKYHCVATLRYGESVLKKVKKTFIPVFSPISVSPSAKETTMASRLNGTKTLSVSAQFSSGRGSITYQWYKIDKDGREAILENERANSMKVRVKDYVTSYKCVITPKMSTSTGGVPVGSLSRIFKFTSDAGYRLKDISPSIISLGVGETKTLFATAETDSGFSLKYQWEKYIGRDADTGEEKYESLGDAGKGSSIQVTPAKRADFIPYRLTITVEKDDVAVGDPHIYRFPLYEDVDLKEETNEDGDWDSDEIDVKAEKGEDASLYVKTQSISNYTQIKTWYKEIARAKYTDKNWNSETDKYDYAFADPGFKEPEGYSYTREVTERNSETSEWESYIVYYQLMASEGDGTTLKLAGKSGEASVDIQGNYLCHVELYRPEDGESQKFSSQDFSFKVTYDSNLYAYAKNKNVKAAAGAAAQLDVIASNKNSTLYPITYKWEKRNDSTGDYTVVNGADGQPAAGASLPFAAVTEADYGTYRATVSDGTAERRIAIQLVKSLPVPVDFTAYTATNNTLVKAVGEAVDLNVDVSIKQGAEPVTDIYYAWYREEKIVNRDDYGYDGGVSKVYWELLGQETNKYSFTVANDSDYTNYRCTVTYKTTSEDGEIISTDRSFYFTLEKPFRFELENLTPQTLYKKVGSPADYGVRIVTNDKEIAEKATYQWYRYDKNIGEDVAIENATAATYHVDALAADDFGRLICKATYRDAAGEEITEMNYFRTYLYSEVKLKNSSERKKVTPGENVTLKPEIDNPAGEELTYQWYRNADDEDEWSDEYYDGILYGSTGDTLALNNIGTGEITNYFCEISCGGIVVATYRVNLTDQEIQDEDALTITYAEGYQHDVKAVLGSSAEFAVQAESSKGLDLKYQWFYGYYDDIYDLDNNAIGGATGASYKIDKVNPSHYGKYTCKVMDAEGNSKTISFYLRKSGGLHVANDAYDLEDTIGYEATLGKPVTLTATATCAEGYTPYYQWYFDGKKLYGETNSALTLENITEKMLGYYQCEIYTTADEEDITSRNFYVYVDTGLTVIPGSHRIVASGNTAKMFVKATAKETITYQWSKFKTVKKGDADYDPSLDKWDEGEYEIYADIKGATSATYSISNIKTEDYGEYRCVVATKGEKKAYYFDLSPRYDLTASRYFANQGDDLALGVATENVASDADYAYTWYVQQPATDTFLKADCTTAKYQAKAPKVLSSDIRDGYCSVGYKCVIKNKKATSKDEETVATLTEYVNILPAVTYETAKLPETNHPFDTEYDIKGYQVKDAKELTVTFDAKTSLDDGETLYVIDSSGNYVDFDTQDFNGKPKTISVSGDRAIFLINGNDKANSYGYKVTSIRNANSDGKPAVYPSIPKSTKKVPAKGKKYTTGNVTYKITKSAAKNGTATVSGVKTKKLKSATIKDTVKISGYTFKVTAISAKAFKGCSKLKSVTIGKNVKTIGANAFAGDKKLKKIKIKGTALKSVGKKAFIKVPKSAKATVPKKKKKAYKKLLKKGKFTGKVK